MKLTINTTMRKFTFRNVLSYTFEVDNGNQLIKINTKKGARSLMLPDSQILWARTD